MKIANFRKAGIIGALGTVAAGGLSLLFKITRQQKRADAARQASGTCNGEDDRMAYLRESNANMAAKPFESTPEWMKSTPWKPDSYKYLLLGSSGSSSSSSSASTSSGQAVAAGKGKGSGGKLCFSQGQLGIESFSGSRQEL